jgi:hypothetical protein
MDNFGTAWKADGAANTRAVEEEMTLVNYMLAPSSRLVWALPEL